MMNKLYNVDNKFHKHMYRHMNQLQAQQEEMQLISIHLKQEHQEIMCNKNNQDMEAIHQVHK